MAYNDRNTRNGLGGGALAAILLEVILVIGGIFWGARTRTGPANASNTSSVGFSQPAAGTTGSGPPVQTGGAAGDR